MDLTSESLPPHRARVIVVTVVNVAIVTGGLLGVYWIAPVQEAVNGGWAVRLVIGLLITGALLGWQVRAIGRAKRPILRAVQALVTCVLTFLVVFALTYLAVSHKWPDAFSEHLDKVSSMYFTVTTFATVGFGDITPVSHAAEVLTTVQMLLDIVVLALTARLLFYTASGAVKRRRAASEVGEHGDG